MRKELLNIIKCPACGNSRKEYFELVEDITIPLEIKEGKLICTLCRETFNIKNGILDLLYKPDREVLDEIRGIIKALEEDGSRHDDQMLLSLPESAESKKSLDPSYKYSLNFYKIIEELKITGQKLVLDIGSGNTWSSSKLAQIGCKCIALDISAPKYKGLESASTYFESYGVYYERVMADMKKLPFVDNSFDIVMSNSSIHHALNLKSVLSEINRVLKKKGKLVLINEAVCSMFSMVRDKNRKGLPEFVRRLNWTENTYSITQYLRYLKSEGFHKTKVFFPPSIDMKLLNLKKTKVDFKNKMIKHRVAYLISFIWANSVFHNILKKIVFWPGMIIFGMPLLLLTEKADSE